MTTTENFKYYHVYGDVEAKRNDPNPNQPKENRHGFHERRSMCQMWMPEIPTPWVRR